MYKICFVYTPLFCFDGSVFVFQVILVLYYFLERFFVTVKAIWAEDLNGVIGDGDTLLWHVPEDLKRFKLLTSGCDIVMGSKTWVSLPFKPLPGRKNIVVSRVGGIVGPDVVSDDLFAVLQEYYGEGKDCWVIGGGGVYEASLPYVDELYVTRLNNFSVPVSDGLVYAPQFRETGLWEESGIEYFVDIERNIQCHFETWIRKN